MSNETQMLDCRSAMQQLWEYVDGELTAERMTAVKRHLEECANCLPHADFAERFLAALHRTRDERGCPQEVRAKVMASLRDAGMKLT